MNIETEWAEIRKFFIQIGKNPPAYNKAVIDSLNQDVKDKCYGWLVGFRQTYIKDYNDVLASVPEVTWNFYRMHEIRGTQEQILLSQAKKQLLEAWKTRPEVLKRESRIENKQGPKATKGSGRGPRQER